MLPINFKSTKQYVEAARQHLRENEGKNVTSNQEGHSNAREELYH